jgi:hypothetical protein
MAILTGIEIVIQSENEKIELENVTRNGMENETRNEQRKAIESVMNENEI